LASLYKDLEAQRAADPSVKIGGDIALQLLAAVGDTTSQTFAKILAGLKKPGISRDDQVALVKKGMSSVEKKDLATILDAGSVPVDDDTKAFFAAVLGRTTPPGRGLKFTPSQHDGLTGFTEAGASIEAINISAAPAGRLHMDDTTVIAKADASGTFADAKLFGDQAIKEGDLIRTRARYADGTTSDWVTVKATGVEARDTRNALVSIVRIGLTDAGGGKIAVENINSSRQVSEPGAKLQFTNSRTKETTEVTIGDDGGFPSGCTLPGKAGDVFSIAATDGVNNTDYKTSVGTLTVPGGDPGTIDLIPDPALHKDELNPDGTLKFSKVRFTGPLYVDGVNYQDVQQGQLGDCYFPSAMSAMAFQDPSIITKFAKDNGDGTYTFTFKERDWSTNKFKTVPITVDGDLYVRSFGGALYGHSANSSDAQKMELWFPLAEKAYAQWKGSYNDIGSGGASNDVFEAVMGKEGTQWGITPNNRQAIFNIIKKNMDAKSPMSAGTYGDDQAARYVNSGVYADHSYSILGYEESGGKQYVKLRNPWGESEPANNGPNDGIFKLDLETFSKLYQNIMYVQ
jgi:hypothetical protein